MRQKAEKLVRRAYLRRHLFKLKYFQQNIVLLSLSADQSCLANMPNISAGLSSINFTASDNWKITGSLHKDVVRRSKKRLCKFSGNVIYNWQSWGCDWNVKHRINTDWGEIFNFKISHLPIQSSPVIIEKFFIEIFQGSWPIILLFNRRHPEDWEWCIDYNPLLRFSRQR